jgi:hypothetical protein
MHAISLGKVTVPTPGVPVLLGTVLTALNLTDDVVPLRKFYKIECWPLLANVGIGYFGLSPTARAAGGVVMNKATGKNIVKQTQVPATTGHQDAAVLEASGDGNSLLIDDYAVDAASANDGFTVFLTVK